MTLFENLLGHTLIAADNVWGLMGVMCIGVALSIHLEQKYQWASKVSGAIIALIMAMVLANLGVIPTNCTLYDDIVWGIVVPMAIPLLLLQCNLSRVWKDTGRMLVVFLIGALGTVVGAFLAYYLLREPFGDAQGLAKVASMMTGSYIGGGVNFAAMASQYAAGDDLTAAATVADNLLMALYFFVLIAMPSINFFRKHYKHPLVDEVEAGNAGSTESYWKAKPMSLQNIAFCFAASTIIVAISTAIANFFASLFPAEGATFILNQLLGNKYLIMTTITMICATAFPKVFNDAPGANEIGTFLIYIFFAVIGAPASIMSIITQAPLLLVYALIIVACNMLITLIFGKIFKFSLEEIILASNANIGGPTTAAAMAISKGWNKLVGPVLLIGTLGYVLGNYYGVLVGNLLR